MKSKVFKGVLLFAGSVAMAVLYLWLFTSVLGYDLPKTAFLKAEHARWDARIDLMNTKLDRYAETLEALRVRDDDIYRSIFGMNEIPSGVREAGIGGVDRYSFLDGLESDNRLKNTALRMDRLTRKAYVQSKSFDEVASVSKTAGDMARAYLPFLRSFRISQSTDLPASSATGLIRSLVQPGCTPDLISR